MKNIIALFLLAFFLLGSSCSEDTAGPGNAPTIATYTDNGTLNSEITVTGTNFSDVAADVSATLNDVPLQVISATATELKLKIAERASSGKLVIKVKKDGKENQVSKDFKYMSLSLSQAPASTTGSAGDAEIKSTPLVTNNSNKTITVIANMQFIERNPGHKATFCIGEGAFGTCYPAMPNEAWDGTGIFTPASSPAVITLEPGETSGKTAFICYVYPNLTMGATKVRYTLYNKEVLMDYDKVVYEWEGVASF